MAIDTKAKRFQMLSFSDGALLPNPDGTIAAEDRAHLLWLYGGIALAAVIQLASITFAFKNRITTFALNSRITEFQFAQRDMDFSLKS